ncbi:MAG: PocR ligand-binding domain-containing protein [Thermodesulfobacteriota bacterium]
MAYQFVDLVDASALAELLSGLHKATGLASMVLDLDGNALTSAGWQPGCGFNHLNQPCLSLHCRRGAAAYGMDPLPLLRRYSLYKCPLGFCDAVSPIALEGEVLGSVHMGQFLTAPPDPDQCREQARRLRVTPATFLEMVKRMPVVEPGRLGQVMEFLSRLAETLAREGLKRVRLAAADQALASSEGRYRRLLASVTNYIYTVRLDRGRIKQITHGPGCESVTGYASRDFERDSLLWVRLVHEKDRQRVMRFFEAVMGGASVGHLEHRIRRRDGVERWIRNTPVVMRGPDGAVALFEGLVQDITEQKRMEEEIRAARLKAEQASRAKSEFLANMSHEIRTPMNAILGFTRLALKRARDTELRDYLERVGEAGASLLSIINDILDFSKIEAGRMELLEEDFDPAEAVESAVRTVEVQARRKGLKLEVDISPGTPRLARADPARFRQVLVNLMGNAVKFTSEGSVSVSAFMEPGGEFTVSVRDTGIGIPPGKLGIIFDTFTQADSTTTRRFGGTGLGLAISRQLAGMMGGRITVESREGEGSDFRFTTPLKPPSARSVQERERPGAHPVRAVSGRALRVLVAEDEPANRLFTMTFLAEEGHEAREAHDGAMALEMLAGGGFDLVLMDVSMPVMDGLEATARIRSGDVPGVPRDIPIVALTAHAIKGDRERFLAAGMDACLVKPMDLDELSAVLESVKRGESPAAGACPVSQPVGEFDRAWLRRWFSGREGTLSTMLGIFRDETPRRLALIREALENSDAGAAAKEAHALKGSAAVVGAVGVRAAAVRLEDAARAGDAELAKDLLGGLEVEWHAARKALEAGVPLRALEESA